MEMFVRVQPVKLGQIQLKLDVAGYDDRTKRQLDGAAGCLADAAKGRTCP